VKQRWWRLRRQDDNNSSPELAKKKKFRSSWDAPSQKKSAKDKGGDYLYELGASDYQNLNIDVGQTSKYLGDSKFTLDCVADIADGSLRKFEFRKFKNIKGDYWIPPRFQDKVTLHLTKNMLKDTTDFFPITPLILGIFGGKGQGKSFTIELILKRLGCEAVIMSAGELEDEVAGRPARLIRERYKKAADMSQARGKLTCLVINDIDAGVGNYADTQKTVNSQMVVGTLMNLCDNPKQVSTSFKWWGKMIRRCPIIVTGNDLNTVYAPLLRDGRMDKFYWEPNDEDRFNMIYTLFKDDNVPPEQIQYLIKTFDSQGLDFFGALKANCADKSVRERLLNYEGGMKGYMKMLLKEAYTGEKKEGAKIKIDVTLESLLEAGHRIAQEQEHMNRIRLANEYLKNIDD
jgi:SpoVK/Ycf46/Vps4 family AAA+-type ATPase